MTHTKGEWKLNPLINPTKPTYYCIYTQECDKIEHIVTVTDNNLIDKEAMHANARLIAAAPNMLEIIKELQTKISEHQHKDSKIIAGYTLAANVGLTDISCKITSLLCFLYPIKEDEV